MHAGTRTGSIICSARAVGGDAGSKVTYTQRRSLHLFLYHSGGWCGERCGADRRDVRTK